MGDDRVPGLDIREGRRRPVILSKEASQALQTLPEHERGRIAQHLEEIGKERSYALVHRQGDERYSIIRSGRYRIVYRDLAPDELEAQGYAEAHSQRGGVLVVAIAKPADLP